MRHILPGVGRVFLGAAMLFQVLWPGAHAGLVGVGALQAAAAAPTLRVEGNQLLANGQPIVLHGVNRSGTEYACLHGPAVSDGPTDIPSVQAIAAWGINAVRVPLNEDCWLGINGMAIGGSAYRQAIVQWVNTLTQEGMVALLDLHWSAPGALAAAGQEPMADNDHAPLFWASVAATFKALSNVIFELYNEPDPVPYRAAYPGGFSAWQAADFACLRNGCSAKATQGASFQTAGAQELLNAVRGTGATNVVAVAGIQAAQTITQYRGDGNQQGHYLPHDPLGNMVVATHMYAADACGDQACWDSTIIPVAALYPVIATEFGDTDCSANFTSKLLPWLDSTRIGYIAWNWGTTFGCQSLVQTYAGTPTQPYGQAYHDHLASLAVSGALPGAPTPVMGPTSTATALPSNTVTATPSPSSTGIPPTTTRIPATATITPTVTAVPPTATLSPTATATSRSTATPSATSTPSASATATSTPTATPTSTATPSATSAPSATSTPSATPTSHKHHDRDVRTVVP